MNLREGLRALRPFIVRLSGGGSWIALGLLLGILTLIGNLGLLGLSGAFLTGAAIAGLTPASAALFNFFLPGAGVRFFAMLRTVCRWVERVVTHEGIFRVLAGLRVWLYRHLALLSPRQVTGHHGGETLNRLVRDVDTLDNLYPRLIMPTISAVIVFGLVVAVFAQSAPTLVWLPVLLILLALPGLPLLGWMAGKSLLPGQVHGRAVLRTHLLDCSEGIEDYSLHAKAWTSQRRQTLAHADHWLRLQGRSGRRGALLRALTTIAVGVCAWGALGLLADLPDSLRPSGPWLAALVFLLLACNEALLPLVGAALDLPGTAAAAQRIEAIAGQPPLPRFVTQGPTPSDGSIEIRDVRFGWDRHTPVFNGFNLSIRSGEHVLLRGASGGGKSTLIQLLTRFEDPQGGSIDLGGVPLAALDEHTLRRQVACVGQHTWAKTGTLGDNLRLADPDASDEQMRAVLTLVGLDPETQGWMAGLDTWIEEGGVSLSGGQRRRLAIARTLLRRAPITLLDEPSEGLDPLAETALIERITTHLRGTTLIWISHRDGFDTAFDRVVRIGTPA